MQMEPSLKALLAEDSISGFAGREFFEVVILTHIIIDDN
jgi:hypothetical protein